MILRDRSLRYALGITKGAPGAVQVADRWHHLKNLGEAPERALQALYPRLKERVTDDQRRSTPSDGGLREDFPRGQADEPTAQDLQSFWENARQSGAYAVRANLTQKTHNR